MKISIILICLLCSTTIYAQDDSRITSIEFVEVLNGNVDETRFYYKNNWKQLRIQALEKNYISSYQLLEVEPTADWPVSFVLITTYGNKEQYDKREDNFGKLIEARGDLRLLNDKKPGEFRKFFYGEDSAKNL